MRPPRVLISYSHDSPEHREAVFRLSERLRKDGVDAWIDQYEPDPDIGWPSWIRRQVEQADKVLLIFTETYKRRFTGYEEIGRGLGATFEGVIVTQALYDNGATNSKFRVVVLNSGHAQFITAELRRFTWYCTDSNENYEKLLRWLKGSPSIVPSPVGVGPDLTPIEPLESTQIETAAVELGRVEEAPQDEAKDLMASRRRKKYEVVFLGTFGGYQTIAYAINESDQVVGEAQLAGGAQSLPFLYRDGQMIAVAPSGRATAINDHGQIVGFASTQQSTFAFTWLGGHVINIEELIDIPSPSFGSGINNSGTIVGYSFLSRQSSVPFVYRGGEVELLNSIQSLMTGVSAINDRDQIVGFFSPMPGRTRAFLYQSGIFSDLGRLLGDHTQALAINNKGQIVGFKSSETGLHKAFLLHDDEQIDLGVGTSMAEGINDAGEVVGQHMRLNQTPFAFLWTAEDGLLDLNACTQNLSDGTRPGFTQIFDAKGINDRGNIAASGNYFDGTKTIQAACMLKRV